MLFLSRVHPKKGIEYLIKAIKKVGNRNLLIAIAGDGDAKYVESLKELAKQENVADQFCFIGGVYGDEKWLQYCQSDLFVLPTFSENFGVVIAEALATGLPVITTKCTPWVELESEKCGCWIDLSVFYLVDSISKLLTVGPSVALQMGIRGQGLVAAKYDIKSVANKLIEKYQMIV